RRGRRWGPARAPRPAGANRGDPAGAPPESRTNTSPRPARLITWPGGRRGGTGARPAPRRSGRANRLTHSTSRRTVGFLASAAIPEPAAAAPAPVSARALLIILLPRFSGRGPHCRRYPCDY